MYIAKIIYTDIGNAYSGLESLGISYPKLGFARFRVSGSIRISLASHFYCSVIFKILG